MKTIYCVIFLILAGFAIQGCTVKGEDTYEEGVKLFQEKKYKESAIKFEETVNLNPDFGEAYLYLGRAYFFTQDYTNSIENFRKSIGVFKQNKFNGKVDGLTDENKVSQVEEVWLPYSQIQQKIQRGEQLTDIEIQKQSEIIRRMEPGKR